MASTGVAVGGCGYIRIIFVDFLFNCLKLVLPNNNIFGIVGIVDYKFEAILGQSDEPHGLPFDGNV